MSALGGSKLADAIFRSSATSSASFGSQGSPGMQHGLVEALQPLLSFVVVLLRSMSPSALEVKLVGMFIGMFETVGFKTAWAC